MQTKPITTTNTTGNNELSAREVWEKPELKLMDIVEDTEGVNNAGGDVYASLS